MSAAVVRLPSESADEAIKRLERKPDGWRLLETDAGQALLREAARMAAEARRKSRMAL